MREKSFKTYLHRDEVTWWMTDFRIIIWVELESHIYEKHNFLQISPQCCYYLKNSRGETIPEVGVAWSRLFYPFACSCPELESHFCQFVNWGLMESDLTANLAEVALEWESQF